MAIEKSRLIRNILLGVFWVVSTFGFISDEIIPPLADARSLVLLVCDGLLVLLGLFTLRRRTDIVLIITFLIISAVSSLFINKLGFAFYLNGLRDFIGLLFLIPVFHYISEDAERRDALLEKLDRHFLVFLILQALCITYQFLKYGAGDHGGGTFGNWYSGEVSTLIYLISFFLLQRRLDRDNLVGSIMRNKLYIILLFPTFLNETKISFVYLALYFLLLLPIDRRLFIRSVFVAPVLLVLIGLGSMVYKSVVRTDDMVGSTNIFSEEFLVNYVMMDVEEAEGDAKWNMEDNEMGQADIPRVTKFLLLAQFEMEHPGSMWTGFGLGHYKGGTTMERTALQEEYDWYFVGTTPYFIHVYIQLGVMGIVWLVLFFLAAFKSHPPLFPVRNWNMHLYLLFVFFIMLVYIEILREPVFCLVYFGLLVLSWKPADGEDETKFAEETAGG